MITPFVFASTGEVNTSPTGILTSARQFSKFVSLDGSSISCIATYRSVLFFPFPLIWTSTAWFRASIKCCWICLYLSLSNVLTFTTSLKISSKLSPISGIGYEMIVKLLCSGLIYWFMISEAFIWNSTESSCCFLLNFKFSSLFSGKKGISPNVSMQAGPANTYASSL